VDTKKRAPTQWSAHRFVGSFPVCVRLQTTRHFR